MTDPNAAAGPAMVGPLDGVLVADLSRVLAGPLATMYLADLGATVVKVERPGTGDDTRAWGPPWTPDGSAYFDGVNRGKYSVAWDLSDERDRAAAAELVRRADVVVENFRAGSLARLGLDAGTVRAANPRVVYCSISGFGDGPGADRPGYDFLVQAVGGLMSITGEADGDPLKVGVALVDVLTGKDAVIGILAALRSRELTGHGEHVRVELLSSLLGGLVNQASGYLATGAAPRRMGNRHPSIAPYETLQCADGTIAVACGTDAQFARLTAALGRPDLAADPRFVSNPDRVTHREELVAALEASLTGAGASVWEQRLAAVGVPAGLVGTVADGVALAERLGLDPVLELDGGRRQIRQPVRFDRAGGGVGAPGPARPAPPPALGQHTRHVEDWLGGAVSDGSLRPPQG